MEELLIRCYATDNYTGISMLPGENPFAPNPGDKLYDGRTVYIVVSLTTDHLGKYTDAGFAEFEIRCTDFEVMDKDGWGEEDIEIKYIMPEAEGANAYYRYTNTWG